MPTDPVVHPHYIREINSVSNTFCLAKWLQVVIDLVHGTTQSCCQPPRHAIPLDALAKSPSALHNTPQKKLERKALLNGEQIKDCSYCWDVEREGTTHSDRMLLSAEKWAFPELENVKKLAWDADINPTYLEVMLDNLCNFSCMYCNADISTAIASEIKQFGPYPISQPLSRSGTATKPAGENPFAAAFWKWLPEIQSGLKVLRVTGGEPFISPQFKRLTDFLETNRQPDLRFAVNSHFGHTPEKFESYLTLLKRLLDTRVVGSLELYTSVEAHGKQAEFIRQGLNYDRLITNLTRACEFLPEADIGITASVNILSISSFQRFLEDVSTLKTQFKNLTLSIAYVHHPEFLAVNIADEDLKNQTREILKTMRASGQFKPFEIAKMQNVVSMLARPIDELKLDQARADFYAFIQEFARRKNSDFLKVFPELEAFFYTCKLAWLSRLKVLA